MKNILFISYDGLTDPLGQSQILPYICGLSAHFRFTILSCEKKEKFVQNRTIIQKICDEYNIDWQYTFFRTSPPILAKFLDQYEMKQKAGQLHKERQFDLIHCRSYIPMEIGLHLKQKYGVKLLFDMRGFWVDERVDGGLWNLKNPVYRLAFSVYKKKEANFIKNADHLVCLTNVAKKEIEGWHCYTAKQPISVIPCVVDFTVFALDPDADKAKAKESLGLRRSDFVVSYLGSLGTWYLFDEMLSFFKELKKTYSDARFLFITPEDPEFILRAAEAKGLDRADFTIRYAAKRQEVAEKIKASDISLVFIKKCYSKMASSPTKQGELLALGIPVICNEGIGDVDEIVRGAKGGLLLKGFTPPDFQKVIQQIPSVMAYLPEEIRNSNEGYYSLPRAIKEYTAIYQRMLFGKTSPVVNMEQV